MRSTILVLAATDFRSRYLGSVLGVVWGFIQPVVTIAVFWFIFDLGFKARPMGDFPFILWLVAGIVPWFYFADALFTATNSITEHKYLVSKVLFRVSTLPVVKALSALAIHLFLILVTILMFWAYGHPPKLIYLQLVYYLAAMMVLLLGISWFTAAANVFLKDVTFGLNVVLQLWFWTTPILWSLEMLPARTHIFLKLNPMFYVITGYRDTFIQETWFWESPAWDAYFWIVALTGFYLGGMVFKRLRPHFANVL
jgi:lipopolysaccharide transport system permease protein/teichoic acid transport system permease protein